MTDTDTDRTTDHDSPWKIALDGYFIYLPVSPA
jgi:hypothetical protein